VSEAPGVALVERAALPFEQRRRNTSERDQSALGIRASVTGEGVLEQTIRTCSPNPVIRLRPPSDTETVFRDQEGPA
jgi:hypothetical protein